MKLPITEKFLWDLYNLFEEIDDFGPSLPSSIHDAIYPDLKRLRQNYDKKRNRWQFAKLIDYLKRKGYLRIKELENKKAIILTPKGIEKLEKINLKLKAGKRRKDKKWQMVIFDIPEKQRLIRNQFRWGLQSLSYQKFQKSIWVCPYDVLKETQNLIKKLSIEQCARLLLVEEMEIS